MSGGGLPKTIVIGNIYRPPRMLVAQINKFINELTLQLQSIGKCKNIIIAGDYNLNRLKINANNTCSDFFDTMIYQSLFPQITLPTRLSNTNATLIDNLFCKFDYAINKTNSGILLYDFSDHQPYFILLNIKGTKSCQLTNTKHIKVYIPTKIAVRNIISNIDASDLLNKLDHHPTGNSNLTYKKIHDIVEQAQNKHMSGKRVKYNKYKHKQISHS